MWHFISAMTLKNLIIYVFFCQIRNMNLSVINGVLLFVPWIFICLPLNGYIHPDEFFQSTEPMASDILNVKAEKTWEWMSPQPCRNIAFPSIVAGLPFWILKQLAAAFNLHLSTTLLVICPRITMGLILLLIDQMLNGYTKKLEFSNEQRQLARFLFRSCHVTLVFFTKTFSNNVEALFFLAILILNNSKKNAHVTNIIIGFLTVSGFFVRQSLICFVVYPIAVKFINCIYMSNGFDRLSFKKSTQMLSSLFIGGLLAGMICFFMDQSYFSMQIESWGSALTPWNLMKYNNDINNLRHHGIHVWYLHLTVNMLLLFGPMYIILLWKAMIIFKNNRLSLKDLLFSLLTPKTSLYFLAATLIPVFILSLVPHQEPRYILPVLIPLIMFISQDVEILRIKRFFIAVCLFNLVGTCWFGFMHQAGVIPSVAYLRNNLETNENKTALLVYWKTYKVPRHLFLWNKNDDKVVLKDMAGSDRESVQSELRKGLANNIDQVLFPLRLIEYSY